MKKIIKFISSNILHFERESTRADHHNNDGMTILKFEQIHIQVKYKF